VFVVVGGMPSNAAAGYNGGGIGTANTASRPGAGGGGATHMSIESGFLNNINVRNNVLIVAGGGGGASGDPNDARNGGAGGGTNGLPGVVGHSGSLSAGAGTQSSGGNAGFWGSSWGTASPGTAGAGGNAGGPTSTSGGGGRRLVRWRRRNVGFWRRWFCSYKHKSNCRTNDTWESINADT